MSTTKISQGAVLDLEMNRSSTYRHTFYYVDTDGVSPRSLENCTVKISFFRSYADDPLYSSDSQAGKDINLVQDEGRIVLGLSPDVITTMDTRRCRYKLRVYKPDGSVSMLCHGKVHINL